MKRIFKSRIFAFILGAVIFGTIGVVATVEILAEDVVYNHGTNVKDALDSIYTTQNTAVANLNNQVSTLQTTNTEQATTISELQTQLNESDRYDFTNYTKNFNISNGTNIKRTASINVNQGTYLVLADIEQAGSSSSSNTNYNENFAVSLSPSYGTCRNLSGKHIFTAASTQFISQYLWSNRWYTLFLCEFTANQTISISNFQTGTYTETFSSVFLDAIKIK